MAMSGDIRTYANHAWDWWREERGRHGPECPCLPCADLRAHFGCANPFRMGVAAMKQAATRLGKPLEEYRRHNAAGERWCGGHQAWEPFAAFGLHVRRGLNAGCEASIRETSRRAMERLRRLRRAGRAS
jgi:hypothetical protein